MFKISIGRFFMHQIHKWSFRVSPRYQKRTECWKNKKRAFLIFLRVHFWIPKALLSLKVYDYVSYVNKHCKKASFFFLTKGQEKSATVEWRETRVLFILWKGGRAQGPSETVWGKLCINAGLLNWKSSKLSLFGGCLLL